MANNKWYTLYIKLSGNSNVEGGVIYNTGTLILNQSKIENTKATSAGAIYNTGNTTIDNSTTNNILAYSGTGGAIINKGTMNIKKSFLNNSFLDINHENSTGSVVIVTKS